MMSSVAAYSAYAEQVLMPAMDREQGISSGAKLARRDRTGQLCPEGSHLAMYDDQRT